jgi:hypothetical protein
MECSVVLNGAQDRSPLARRLAESSAIQTDSGNGECGVRFCRRYSVGVTPKRSLKARLKDPDYVYHYHTDQLKAPGDVKIASTFGNAPVLMPNDAAKIAAFLDSPAAARG